MRYFEFVVGLEENDVNEDYLIDMEDAMAQAIAENFEVGVIVDFHREITVED